MTMITYDEGGLHLITGSCIAIDACFDDEDEGYGHYTILDDNNNGYCLTLNLPIGNMSPPNKYPAINDRVIVRAEGIDRVNHPQHRFTGYAEICQVATEQEIKVAREHFSANIAQTTVQILPKPMSLTTLLYMYDALNDIGKRHFIKECIHPDDQAILHKYIGVGFFIPSVLRTKYKFVEWNLDTALRAIERGYYRIAHDNYGLANDAEIDAETLKILLGNQ